MDTKMNIKFNSLWLCIFFSLISSNSLSSVLPDTEPALQYKFALETAMDGNLQVAEEAFIEITEIVGHDHRADALFWLGRTQFELKKFEDATTALILFVEENKPINV